MLATQKHISILTVEDNPADLYLLEGMLKISGLTINQLYSADRISTVSKVLEEHAVNVILLDLSLPDSFGMSTFHSVKEVAGNIPIIILTGLSDTTIALEAIKEGAQDYLVKGEFNENLLSKSISYSIERTLNLESLKENIDRFNTAAKATNDVIWDWDLEKDEVFVAQENYQKLFGYSIDGPVLPSRLWQDVLYAHDRSFVLQNLRNFIASNNSNTWNEEYCVIKTDGDIAYVQDRCYMMRNNQGKPTRLIGSMHDITERKKAEQKLAEEQRVKHLEITEAVLTAQENERAAIGAELHDNINQILATVKLYLDVALNGRKPIEGFLTNSRDNLILAIEEIRKLSKTMVAPGFKDTGLIESIESLVQTIHVTQDMEIELEHNLSDENILPDEQKLAIYRITQEQLTNILKHAQATCVSVSLHTDKAMENITLSIKDNGKGFNPKAKRAGVGITNIMGRAELFSGNVEVESSPGEGCKLIAVMKVKKTLDDKSHPLNDSNAA